MRDRLIALLQDTFNYTKGVCIDFDEAVEINADHLLANGVIVPPCKVGDSVFIIDDYDCDPYVIAVRVDGIKSDQLGEWIVVRYPLGIKYSPQIPIEDIGKTVFLTREEAERALKGGAE